jgi:hypothetical protein
MPVTDIKEIRILPPLAIGRFGSSAEPMHNYEADITSATGFRALRAAETLMINPSTGEVVAKQTPPAVRFKDAAGRVKPVCPFLEIWARFDNETELRPLTLTELGDLGRGPEHIAWEATFANLKILRRTGEPGDRVEARITGIVTHDRRALQGRCANFKADRFVVFGSVQYVKPTPAFPEIRLRFTPPAGLVYGHTASAIIPAENAVYDRTRGTWDTHTDAAVPASAPDPRAHLSTIPSFIYARSRPPRRNLGYLDDASDGIVSATLTLQDGRRLSAFARAAAGPPDYAPDSSPVRSMQDELEQIVFGPEALDVTAEQVLDTVRRALETMRLMNTDVLNAEYSDNAFAADRAAYGSASVLHTGLLDTLAKGLAAAATPNERQGAHATLQKIDAILREYDAIGDQRPAARTRMPGMMRGADGNDLALNRRRRSQIRKALEVFKPAPSGGVGTEAGAMIGMITNFAAFAAFHTDFAEDDLSLADRFSDPPKVLDYLRKAVAKGSVATAAGVAGQPLVVPGDPAGSAFLKTISRPEHRMNRPISTYRDPTSGKTGFQVIEAWIVSLGPGA